MTRDDIKAFGLITALSLAALVAAPSQAAQPTDDHSSAVGHITVAAPKQGSIMHMRGMVGRGIAVLRLSGDRGCARMKLRFVAGDFSGFADDDWGEIVRLEIRSSSVVTDLMRGIEVISDDLRVSSDPADPLAEIVVHSGIRAETGFVINPGTSPIRDFFRNPGRPVSCRVMTRSRPGAEG